MAVTPNEVVRCDQCDSPLESDSAAVGCLNCLLVGGLASGDCETHRFQHYDVRVLSDGSSLHELGRGAMGITYQAIDRNLGSIVALKVIGARHSENPEVRERFRREARAAAQLRHPNIASVFHFGETQSGQCFYAMELVEGETLEHRVKRAGPLPAPLALDVAKQITRALVAAEIQGLVHRDLKPSNIMVVDEEADGATSFIVKVIDFGLAKPVAVQSTTSALPHSSFSGTPAFASPEQFTGDPKSIDSRSDIYSLGVTLWYLLTAKTPFGEDMASDVHARQLSQPLPLQQLDAVKVPAPIITLLRSMLAAAPAQRPQTARQLLSEVQSVHERVEKKSWRKKLAAPAAPGLTTPI